MLTLTVSRDDASRENTLVTPRPPGPAIAQAGFSRGTTNPQIPWSSAIRSLRKGPR